MSPTPSPRVAAFENLAYGMFVHWGLYSQLARGEWVQHAEKIPTAGYMKLMQTFTAKDFDAGKLARMAKRNGMNYITHTTRHHEGFSLYDTQGLSPLDVTHTPCGRDLVREFIDACRAEGLVPMLYHTTLDWNDPRFDSDWEGYLKYLRDSVELLCTRYGRIGGLWFDGNWSRPDADWHESELYAVIRKHQPEAIIINNTGTEELGRTGHPEIDSVTFERGRPVPMDREGKPKYIAAEMCHTMNFHWGTAAKDFNFLSPAHVIEELCFARRAGANLLLNIGPLEHGALPPYETAALAKVGDWIETHGGKEGPLYRGKPCGVEGEGDDFGLAVGHDLYLFVTGLSLTSNTVAYPTGVRGPGPRPFTGVPEGFGKAQWMDSGEELKVEREDVKLVLHATKYPYGTNTVIRVAKLTR
ncbi:MAG TPA: alpha-L-fucosidase [Fimbriimonadaceae bacterium]|nr:alpha-L-fucosidase [Fimbriimonadaceae bacterium]